MPYLSIQTNQALDEPIQQELMQKASALVAAKLGKSESYVMVAIKPDTPMLFAGNDTPVAYLEMKSIGLPDTSTGELSSGLCTLLSDMLGLDQGRIYIEFSKSERHLWDWNGSTF